MNARSPGVMVNPLPTTLLTLACALFRATPSPAAAASTTTDASANPTLALTRQRPRERPAAAVDPMRVPAFPLMLPAFQTPKAPHLLLRSSSWGELAAIHAYLRGHAEDGSVLRGRGRG